MLLQVVTFTLLGAAPPRTATLDWSTASEWNAGFTSNESAVFIPSYGAAGDDHTVKQFEVTTGKLVRSFLLKGRCEEVHAAFADARSLLLLCHTSESEGESVSTAWRSRVPSSVVAFDVTTGRHRWSWVLPMDSGSFACDSQGCIVNLLATLVMLDTTTGRVRWKSKPIPHDLMMFVEPVLTPTTVYGVSSDDYGKTRLFAFARKTGQVSWQRELPGGDEVLVSSHFVVVRAVVRGACEKGAKACKPVNTDHVSVFEQRTGKPLWEKDFAEGTEVTAAGELLFVTTAGVLQSFDLASGEARWKRTLAPEPPLRMNVHTTPLVSGASVLLWLRDEKQNVSLCGLEQTTGTMMWSWPLPAAPVTDAGTPDSNALVLGTRGDHIFVSAFDQLWSLRVGGVEPASPRFAPH